jgi:hypothetical protein
MREVVDRGQKYATGTNTAAVVIPPTNGNIVGRRSWYTSPDAGTIVLNRARSKMLANAAVSGSTALVIKTDVAGKVDGAVVSTSDYVLVQNPTTGAWVLSTVTNVAAVTVVSTPNNTGTVALTLGTAVTCSAEGPVYLVRSADIVSLTTAAETLKDLDFWFASVASERPIHVILSATGTCKLAVCWDVER